MKNNEIKTAALITVHIGANFGSNLQTIATGEILKKIGYNTIVVNYIPDRVTKRAVFKSDIKECKTLRCIIRGCVHVLVDYINNVIYSGYLKKHCKLTKPLYSTENFAEWGQRHLKGVNVYITGSDQVWNSIYNEGIDTHYFWDGFDGNKIAYSSSIGAAEIGDRERELFLKYLSKYKAISVRESQAKEILKGIGINSTLVLDPTFMLPRKEWIPFASKRIIKRPYILAYIPYNITDKVLIYKSINKIAKERNLMVVNFSWNWHRDTSADYSARFSSPGDFLSLMMYADCVVTNSFHGTAFSINLNKDFWVYMPSKFPSRIESILALCNLKNRVLSDVIEDKQIQQRVNYEIVNNILDEERAKAFEFLNKALL